MIKYELYMIVFKQHLYLFSRSGVRSNVAFAGRMSAALNDTFK